MKKKTRNKHIDPDDDSTTVIAQPCSACGFHQTIAGAVLGSKEWREWYDLASGHNLYDVDETATIDAMSDEHWADFVNFIRKTK